MWEFLVDEDLPRSTAIALRQAGYAALDVRDVGLRGQSDAEIFAFAQARPAVIVTADKGIANVMSFPLGTHAGLMVLRVPNELSTQQLNREIIRALSDLQGEDLIGLLIIVEVGRTRIRRPSFSDR